jgi:hypothetical protein
MESLKLQFSEVSKTQEQSKKQNIKLTEENDQLNSKRFFFFFFLNFHRKFGTKNK